ncbi:MAG: hypothetical protein K2J82_03045 [Muribaculaceae bacterium]|nr:hypothetical protein [Muribaculaceae bacterium]MDE6753569.1 hypothetical protein [Muribaculaceae bacterium]
MKHRYLTPIFLSAALFSGFLTSCSDKNDGPEEPSGEIKKTILLYAVASNNLYSNLKNDKHEIILAAKDMDLKHYSLLLYQVTPEGNPQLLELRKKGEDAEFVPVKEYDRALYSTDPERISEVIDDACSFRKAKSYGLILWSHALGWSPFFSERDNHPASSAVSPSKQSSANILSGELSKADLVMQYSFGSDTNSETNYTDKIDIDDLASAIPDHRFEFIWFDACMMSGIETIYELRDKCEYFGAYPTEVFSPGMPYDLTLPYLLKEKSDLRGCAEAFFNYYAHNSNSYLQVATVAVMDMSKLEDVASYCKKAYSSTEPPSTVGMNYYSGSQRVAYPYYDFGQYTKALASQNEENDVDEFKKLMDKFVIYKAATEKEFMGNRLNLDEYSGISCHVYKPTQSGKNIEFYKSLDWFKRVY